MPRQSDKRERLLHSADSLILRQGFRQTTLADIAEDSGVPLGNVYYYFRTKEEIGRQIIESRLADLQSLLDACERRAQPRQRLLAFLDYPLENEAALAANGCPLGTLAYELSHTEGPLRDLSKALINHTLQWLTTQFQLLGKDNAAALALQFLGNLQGMSLVANALHDPSVIRTLVEQNRSWLETL